MGVERMILNHGDRATYPRKGDTVTIEYTGWLLEGNMQRGKQ